MKDRTEAEMLGRNEGNNDNTQISITDSSMTTSRVISDLRNRWTDHIRQQRLGLRNVRGKVQMKEKILGLIDLLLRFE